MVKPGTRLIVQVQVEAGDFLSTRTVNGNKEVTLYDETGKKLTASDLFGYIVDSGEDIQRERE